MEKHQSREGSSDAKLDNVISLAAYREKHKPPEEAVPEIHFSIKDGELIDSATHIKPSHVPIMLQAMSEMSARLVAFLDAAKTASCIALFLTYLYVDTIHWPAMAASLPASLHATKDLTEGRGGNMHKWLAQSASML
jgi:hypothetical protein